MGTPRSLEAAPRLQCLPLAVLGQTLGLPPTTLGLPRRCLLLLKIIKPSAHSRQQEPGSRVRTVSGNIAGDGPTQPHTWPGRQRGRALKPTIPKPREALAGEHLALSEKFDTPDCRCWVVHRVPGRRRVPGPSSSRWRSSQTQNWSALSPAVASSASTGPPGRVCFSSGPAGAGDTPTCGQGVATSRVRQSQAVPPAALSSLGHRCRRPPRIKARKRGLTRSVNPVGSFGSSGLCRLLVRGVGCPSEGSEHAQWGAGAHKTAGTPLSSPPRRPPGGHRGLGRVSLRLPPSSHPTQPGDPQARAPGAGERFRVCLCSAKGCWAERRARGAESGGVGARGLAPRCSPRERPAGEAQGPARPHGSRPLTSDAGDCPPFPVTTDTAFRDRS